MTQSHLLYWIFKWLFERHPWVLDEMELEFFDRKWSKTEGAWTIKQSLEERLVAFRAIYKKVEETKNERA